SLRAAQLVGLTSSLFISGINFSAGHLTLPILYRLPGGTASDIFQELYFRGAWTVAPLAILSTLSSGTAAYLAGPGNTRLLWAAVGGATISTQIWTAFFMMPTNNELIRISQVPEGEKREEEAKKAGVNKLLRKWVWMNHVRAALAATGGL
ncbi:hypothetical protein K431DRAFT_189516, partial [Polychaeton citri CBS 116435]